MAITNQQLTDWLKEAVQAEKQAIQMFTATVDRFIEHDRANHIEFRQAIVLLQTEQKRAREDRQEARDKLASTNSRLWTYLIGPIIVAVVTVILQLVIK